MNKPCSSRTEAKGETILVHIPNEKHGKAHIASILSEVDVQFQIDPRKLLFERSRDLVGSGSWVKE